MAGMSSVRNGPTGMYKLNPFFDKNASIELPTCMYKVKSVHGSSMPGVVENGDPALVELEKRQENLLAKLEILQSKVNELAQKSGSLPTPAATTQSSFISHSVEVPPLDSVVRDLVISANPAQVPLSVAVLYHLLSQQYKVITACHVHSSLPKGVSECLRHALGNGIAGPRQHAHIALTLIWKDVKHGPTLMVSPNIQTIIQGEGSVARYLARLLSPAYDAGDIILATEIDNYVDLANTVSNGTSKEKTAVLKTLNARLGKENFLVGGLLSLADIVLWSAIQQSKLTDTAPSNVKKWIERCSVNPAFGIACKLL